MYVFRLFAAADEARADAVGDLGREAAVGGRADGAPAQDPAHLRHPHVSDNFIIESIIDNRIT